VDVCSDAPAGAQRAERAADGGVGDVSRALSGSPRVSCIIAQRVARFDPYKQHLDNLRRKDSLEGARTTEIFVRLEIYSASYFEGSAYNIRNCLPPKK
jgi:hypothetical protein